MSDRAAPHFRRRTIRALPLVLVAVVATSCDSPPELEPEVVEKVETCDEIVPIGEELVRRLFEAVEGAPLEMVIGEAPPSEELAALRAIGTQLDERAARLSCDAAVLNAAIVAETDDLESDDPVAQIFLDVVREGVVGTLPPPPPTTTTTTAAPTP
jgi:hypothetical protein